jgi:hypothetical protein
MLALLEKGLLPNFAFNGPWVQDLSAQGKGATAPPRLCWAAEDVILLAPHRVDQAHWGGFLIAQASACGKVRQFASEAGDVVLLRVPADAVSKGAFSAAKSNATLAIEGRENSV